MDETHYRELIERLDVLTGLLLCRLLSDESIEPRQLMVGLRKTGVAPGKIAELLGVTPNAVRVATHRARRKSKRSKRRTKKR